MSSGSSWPRDFGGASNDERLAFCIYHTRQIVNKSVVANERASSPASKRFQLTEKDYSRIKALTQSPYLFYERSPEVQRLWELWRYSQWDMNSHSVARVQDMLGQWAPRERASTAPAGVGSGGGGGASGRRSDRFRRRGLMSRGGTSQRTTVTEEVKDAGPEGADGPGDAAASGPAIEGSSGSGYDGGGRRSPSPTGRLGRHHHHDQNQQPESRVPNHPSFLTGAEKRAHLEALRAEQSTRPVWRPGGAVLVGWTSLRQRAG